MAVDLILSHKYRFIFIKTAKTAGTSIEIALSKFCGQNDVITPIVPEDERTRASLGYSGPQNFYAPLLPLQPRDVMHFLRYGERRMNFYNHIGAADIRARIPHSCWRDYFKFCFERNPWDRAVSLYYWRNQTNPQPLAEFIQSDDLLLLKRQGIDLYTINGQVAVDRICRYERLHDDLEDVRRHLGIPETLKLPSAKAGVRNDTRNYRDVLGASEQTRIADLFRDEIKLMDYGL